MDTGCSVSILTVLIYVIFKVIKLAWRISKAKDYGNNVIEFVVETTVGIKTTIKQHTFLGVYINKASPFERDLCRKVYFSVNMPKQPTLIKLVRSDGLFNKFNECLPPSYKSNVRQNNKLKVDDDCKPLYYGPGGVPFQNRCFVKEELVNIES